MKEKILIVEDQFVEADYLRMMLVKAGYHVLGIAHSVADARALISRETPDFVLLDIFLKGKLTGIDLARELAEETIAFVFLSANSNEEVLNAAKATQPYGFLVKPFREKDLLITLEIARYRHEHSLGFNVRKENILKDKISAIIHESASRENKLLNICLRLQPHIGFEYMTAGFDADTDLNGVGISFLRIARDEYQKMSVSELLNVAGIKSQDLIGMVNSTPREDAVSILSGRKFEDVSRKPSLIRLFSELFQMRSCISLPLHFSKDKLFTFCFYSREPQAYHADHIGILNRLQRMLTNGMETILDMEQAQSVHAGKKNSAVENPGHDTLHGFEGIVGKSPGLLNVFDLITQVATSDTSVLILGESGTGKERIADCIHHLSPRKDRPFVKVNCAALPANLIESELFGHEKGSFTGALDKRIGKFEKADKGTIFLDEIGEMPIDLQVKLLRVLQEKYIERIGSRDITKVDVRIIAATNRNLEKEVAEGRFRLDLYYRLNVFPIVIPPLRERTEDIPLLAGHFIHYFNRKSGKKITGFSERVLKAMLGYYWPGNIRELENLIERSVLLAKGTVIEDIAIPVMQKKELSLTGADLPMKTIHENERDYIMSVLKKCNGRIWGPGGAAEVLNIPPSTLKSKMNKLGIRKAYFE